MELVVHQVHNQPSQVHTGCEHDNTFSLNLACLTLLNKELLQE